MKKIRTDPTTRSSPCRARLCRSTTGTSLAAGGIQPRACPSDHRLAVQHRSLASERIGLLSNGVRFSGCYP